MADIKHKKVTENTAVNTLTSSTETQRKTFNSDLYFQIQIFHACTFPLPGFRP